MKKMMRRTEEEKMLLKRTNDAISRERLTLVKSLLRIPTLYCCTKVL